jgi:gamma-glutamylcyclotransferase (GGCT)/AIG2-like uncharacterized protein YtfP
MPELTFFYGTLMTPFNRTARLRVNEHLVYTGRGSIASALFDLGIYPAAVPEPDGRVWGEVYEMTHPSIVLQALDELEGYRPEEPESSLYTRTLTNVTLEDGRILAAWAYFYNAPLGRAERIESGDYLEHLKVRKDPPDRREA